METRAARFIAGSAEPDRFPHLDVAEVAFVGRSNVGKSSLLNRLVGRRSLARVSKTPGRTQQINFFLVEEEIMLADLPGYGFARVPIGVKDTWKELVESYLTQRRQLRAVCVLVDVRRGITDGDRTLLSFLQSLALPWIVAVTKIDKFSRSVWLTRCRSIADGLVGGKVIACSAVSGEGMVELWAEIQSAARAANR